MDCRGIIISICIDVLYAFIILTQNAHEKWQGQKCVCSWYNYTCEDLLWGLALGWLRSRGDISNILDSYNFILRLGVRLGLRCGLHSEEYVFVIVKVRVGSLRMYEVYCRSPQMTKNTMCVCVWCVELSWPGRRCVIAGLLLLSLMGNDTFAN